MGLFSRVSLKDRFRGRSRKSISDGLNIRGDVVLTLRDKDGNVKWRDERQNLVVTAGKNFLAGLLAAESLNDMNYAAIGTSNTAASAGQTALVGTELARVTVDSHVRTDNAVEFVATFPAGTGTGTLNEAGFLNAASSGTMLARVVFSGAVTKAADDEFQISWTLTIG